jgi:hypothetical protein
MPSWSESKGERAVLISICAYHACDAALIRSELMSRSALVRERKGKSSSREARANIGSEPKCCNMASAFNWLPRINPRCSMLFSASERENMLLHIFRLEAKANAKAAGGKSTQAQEPRAQARRVEDIIGEGSAVAERTPFMPQTVLLRCQCGRRLSMRAKRDKP